MGTRTLTAGDIGALTTSGKAADSNLLDGIDSGSFLRSDATDYLNGVMYVRADIRNEDAYRDHGMYGHYDSTKTNHMWSMGSAYRSSAAGTDFGNLYGLAYKHTNNPTGGTMGGGHQMVWCSNGTPLGSMGLDRVWHAFGMRVGSSDVWHAGNDGAGSGLDADLLDGQHASAFLGVSAKAADSNLLDGLDLHTGRNNEANKVVRTDASGYIQAGWINTTSGLTTGTGRIYASNDSYLRYVTNDTFRNNLGLWWSGNDGSGSGLDADLLDGQHGSYYAPASHSHSLTLSGDVTGSGSVSGTISVSVNNDSHSHSNYLPYGTGGTVDVNSLLGTVLLTGSTGTWTNRGPSVNNAGALLSLNTHPGSYYSQLWFDTAGSSFYHRTANNVTPTAAWRKVWDSGNDGSGSGLDADLLDGQHASAFAPVSHSHSYLPLSGGTLTGNVVAPQFRVGDGGNGYFFTDSDGRTAFAGGDFYIQESCNTYYNYANNQYHGNSSGDNHYFRGNALSGNNWTISTVGAANFSGGVTSGNYVTATGNITSNNGWVKSGAGGFYVSSNQIVDSGRNLLNIGNITCSGTNNTYGDINIRENVSAPGYTFMRFQSYSTGATLGSIYRSYGSMVYSTSSDYRLKENIVNLTGASDKIKSLPVRRFNFIEHPDRTVDGFLAHEVAAVVPEAVLGEKDAVDSKGKPVYQAIDQSKLVPLLTAGLQEALAEIEKLKARLSALEN